MIPNLHTTHSNNPTPASDHHGTAKQGRRKRQQPSISAPNHHVIFASRKRSICKPFACPLEWCPYRCKQKSNLKAHTATHLKIRSTTLPPGGKSECAWEGCQHIGDCGSHGNAYDLAYGRWFSRGDLRVHIHGRIASTRQTTSIISQYT